MTTKQALLKPGQTLDFTILPPVALGYYTADPTSVDGSAVQFLVALCFRAGERMTPWSSERHLDPDGLDKLAGQSDGAALVALLQLAWQRCARLQPRREQATCAPACGCVGWFLTV